MGQQTLFLPNYCRIDGLILLSSIVIHDNFINAMGSGSPYLQ